MSQPPSSPSRPEFMVTLGLLPPYSEEDVRQAYLEKAKVTHPDKGGSAKEFREVSKAYEEAKQYVQFYKSRRSWLAAQVERYVQQEEVVDKVRRLGGSTLVEEHDWMQQTFGEGFSSLAGNLRKIILRDIGEGAEFLQYIAERPLILGTIQLLDLRGSVITDESLQYLQGMELLSRLNLASTPVTKAGLEHLRKLPGLEEVNIAKTGIGWWARVWMQLTRRCKFVVSESETF